MVDCSRPINEFLLLEKVVEICWGFWGAKNQKSFPRKSRKSIENPLRLLLLENHLIQFIALIMIEVV